jgi:mRNA interferase RelE/StbE
MPYIGFAFTNAALDFLEGIQPKIRKQIIKKAKALHTNPFPQGFKKLHDVETSDGLPVYRERSGDYRILYVVRSKPDEVIILDIDHRKDVYRMPKTNTEAADEMRMKEADFDEIMGRALGVAAPVEGEKDEREPKRLSPFPRKKG